MQLSFKQPDLVRAMPQEKAKPAWLEVLIFLGIFLLVELCTSLVQLVFLLPQALICQRLSKPITAADMMPTLLLSQLASIFLMLLLAKAFRKRQAWTFGFKKRNMGREYIRGAILGLSLMTLMAAIGMLTGSLVVLPGSEGFSLSFLLQFLVIFAGYLCQGMFEEVAFRGYLIPALARKKGHYWMAILVSALLFAAAHLGNPGISFLAFLNLTLFGIFAGIYFVKRGDLWGIGALHALWNFTQGNVWGVLVSGMDPGPTLMISMPIPGKELLSGGSFGLEGGFIATAVLLFAILVVLQTQQKDPAPAKENS